MDLLPDVLQFVDCKQRLGNCARVAHSWQAAATEASADICINLKRQPDPTASLCHWLTKHGGRQVQSISMRANSDYVGQPVVAMKLPFQHLQQLRSLSLQSRTDCDIQLQRWPAQQHTSSSTAGISTNANSSKRQQGQHWQL
jgi:hypothetical protein